MAKTVKATERVRLVNGDVMTLGEAIAAGRVVLKARTEWSSRVEREVTTYTAWDGDEGFPISKSLYESRMGLPVSARVPRA